MRQFGVLGEPLKEHLEPPEDDEEEEEDGEESDEECETCLYRGKYCEGCYQEEDDE